MAFKFDFNGDTVYEWTRTTDGIKKTTVTDYHPTIFVEAMDRERDDLREWIRTDPRVHNLSTEHWFVDLHAQTKTPVLRIDLSSIGEVRSFGHDIIKTYEIDRHPPGTYQLYNVDLPPEFRYCIETSTPPIPQHKLRSFHLEIGEKSLADRDISTFRLNDETTSAPEPQMLERVHAQIQTADPDVLIVNRANLIPLLYAKADAYDHPTFDIGRETGYEQLAGENTVESYGQTQHSPARFNIPGRAVLDTSNSFMWSHSSLAGILNLVARSWRPLQETAWASIGTILTSIQIRLALQRNVLVPWNKWEPEQFKDTRTLHHADRGGFTFEPDVGLHENVVEIDYASLYPNIICEYNISPETILCPCHPDRTTIPTLDYNVCDQPGVLPDVLRPILADRAAEKQTIQTINDDASLDKLRAKSNAFKWILVTCFGYQGYRNAKWGRIECHEAINAVARDILLTSKDILEAHGWEVVHGIVDSLWIRANPDRDQTPIKALCDELTTEIGITIEHEADYDWIAFVPKRNSQAGALTKYFGKLTNENAFKYRGIEIRQRSTPQWIKDAQRELITVLDTHRSPEAVCDRVKRYLGELHRGAVDPVALVIKKRVSKRIEDYSQETLNVAALRRAATHGVELSPGENVRYVVVDNEARTHDRVRLHFEDINRYDASYYSTLLLRACESVVSPLEWDRHDIKQALRNTREPELTAFK